MGNHFQEFLEGVIATIELAGKKLEALASTLLSGLLDFLERALEWIVRVCERIVEYLKKLLPVLGRLISALFKLSLFYLPGVILVIIGLAKNNNTCIVLGVIWVFLITAIGLAYGKHSPK